MNDATKKNRAAWPWRPGNDIELLVDGSAIFTAMLEAIGSAKRFVVLEIYLISSGRVVDQFIDKFLEVAERGVKVYLLLDHYGARGLRGRDRRRLDHPGVELCFYNPFRIKKLYTYLLRDHRKLLCADDRVAITGGMGLSDEFIAGNHPGGGNWHETGLVMRGPVVTDWMECFLRTWRAAGGSDLGRHIALPAINAVAARLVASSGFGNREIQRSAVKRIRHANERVWLATAYFVPPMKMRRALRAAAGRGIDVRLLLPGQHIDHPGIRHASRRHYARLLHHGVRIFEYQPRFLHMKILAIDDWVSAGSSNFDRWTFRWNLEANLEIADVDFARRAYAQLESDLIDSIEINYHAWMQRKRLSRWLEWFWGKIDRLLASLSNKYQ